MMNKWKEFDDIHTPEDWKKITYTQKKKHYSFSMVLTAVIVCISLITVSAFHSDMSEWLTNHFSKEDIHPVENVTFKDIRWYEVPFGYTYTKDDKIKNIYLMHHNQIKLQKPRTYKGIYKKPFSFKYVRYHHDIFMYDFSGYLEYGVNRIFNNTVYLCTKKNDIIALNMKTGNIGAITTDHRSVNPYLSPHGRYLLINKQDEYWTIYDTVNKTEKIVPDMCGYALSNEHSFYGDDYIITYGDDYTIVIDCATQKVIEKWNGITEFASAFELVDNTIINHVTRKSCEIKEENYRIKIASSTSQYLLITNENEDSFYDKHVNYYLYDIQKNSYVPLSLPFKNGVDISLYEYEGENKLIIYDDKQSYLVNLQSLFQ